VQRIDLTANRWQLKGFWPLGADNGVPETFADGDGVTEWVRATVPGSVQWDLHRAGLIEHPHAEGGAPLSEWIEHRWWAYRTSLTLPGAEGRMVELVMDWLDRGSGVYLNGHLVATQVDPSGSIRIDVTALVGDRTEHELCVLLPAGTPTFAGPPRLQDAGIRKTLGIELWETARFADVDVTSDLRADGIGRIDLVFGTALGRATRTDTTLAVRATCSAPDGSDIRMDSVRQEDASWRVSADIPDAEDWIPGQGQQPLFELEVQLTAGGIVVDRLKRSVAVRREGMPDEVRAVTLAPLDLHAGVLEEQYELAIRRLASAHVNCLSVEHAHAVDIGRVQRLCDRYGILVVDELPSTDVEQGAGTSDTAQWTRADSLQRAIEVYRRDKGMPPAVVFNESHPNNGGCALVDYDGSLRQSFSALRTAYAPVHASLVHIPSSHIGDPHRLEMFGHHTDGCVIRMTAHDLSGTLIEEVALPGRAGQSELLGFTELPSAPQLVIVRLILEREDVEFHRSEYVIADTRKQYPAPQLEVDDFEDRYRVGNVGNTAALFVHVEGPRSEWIAATPNHFCLLPGERRIVRVERELRVAGGFASSPALISDRPDLAGIAFRATFGQPVAAGVGVA
jgi:hypothetical protein